MGLVIKKEENLTINTVFGDFAADDVIDALEAFYSGEPTENVLWDFSAARVEPISSDDVRRMSDCSRRYEDKRAGGKTALVFSAELGYALGRMFGMLQEVQDTPVFHRTFRSIEEAMDWLNEPRES